MDTGLKTCLLRGRNGLKQIHPAAVFCSGVARFEKRSITMDSRWLADYTNVLFRNLTESILRFDGITDLQGAVVRRDRGVGLIRAMPIDKEEKQTCAKIVVPIGRR